MQVTGMVTADVLENDQEYDDVSFGASFLPFESFAAVVGMCWRAENDQEYDDVSFGGVFGLKLGCFDLLITVSVLDSGHESSRTALKSSVRILCCSSLNQCDGPNLPSAGAGRHPRGVQQVWHGAARPRAAPAGARTGTIRIFSISFGDVLQGSPVLWLRCAGACLAPSQNPK